MTLVRRAERHNSVLWSLLLGEPEKRVELVSFVLGERDGTGCHQGFSRCSVHVTMGFAVCGSLFRAACRCLPELNGRCMLTPV